MMQNSASLHGSQIARSGWFVRAVVGSAADSFRCFVASMKAAASRERSRRHVAHLDARLLQDIGLEPFDVYYGWRGSSRH